LIKKDYEVLKMRNTILLAVFTIFLLGCHPYRLEVQQGNIIDNKMMSQLHLGMSKNEVISVLGTPILIDTFNTDTWTYAYSRQKGSKTEKKKLVLEFKKDKLAHID